MYCICAQNIFQLVDQQNFLATGTEKLLIFCTTREKIYNFMNDLSITFKTSHNKCPFYYIFTANCKQEIFKLPILTEIVTRIVIEYRPLQYCLNYKIEQNFIGFHKRPPVPRFKFSPTIRKFLTIIRTSPFLTQIQFKHSLTAHRHGDMQP